MPGELTKQGSTVNYGVAPFPAADGKESVTLGVQDHFFGFKKDGNQEPVQKFLSFLYQPDNYAAFLTAAGGFLPATISAGAQMSSDPVLKPFIDVLPSAILYPGDQASWPAVQGAIQQTIGTAVQGADPQQVLDQIQAAATALYEDGYISTIPVELEEAAQIDGCSRIGVLFRITFPLALPGIVTATIFTFISAWNEFVIALTLTSSPDIRPLTVGVTTFIGQYEVQWNYLFAAPLIAVVPVVILFAVIERWLVGGLTAGGIK